MFNPSLIFKTLDLTKPKVLINLESTKFYDTVFGVYIIIIYLFLLGCCGGGGWCVVQYTAYLQNIFYKNKSII